MHQTRAAIGLQNRAGDTALHMAACLGHHVVVKQLLQHPEGIAGLCSQNNRGETAVHQAASNECVESVWTLLLMPQMRAAAALKDRAGATGTPSSSR